MTDSTKYAKRFTAEDQLLLMEQARTISHHLWEIETQLHILSGGFLGLSTCWAAQARGQTPMEYMDSGDDEQVHPEADSEACRIADALADDVSAMQARLEEFVAAVEAQS